MMNEHQRSRKFKYYESRDEANYYVDYARMLIEFYAIVDENYEHISKEGTAWEKFLASAVNTGLSFKRELLRAIETIDFDEKDEILINNLVYDLNNFIEKVHLTF